MPPKERRAKSGKELGIGIIGYSIGKAHARAWSSVDDYFHPTKLKPRLVAICGRDRRKASFEAERFGFERTYTDWSRLVDDEDVTLVDNCTPPFLHAEPMIEAARLGKHLFCEKPLARTAGEAKLMLDAAEKARVKHMVGYNYRFLPAVILARDMIRSGELGEIYLFKGAYLNSMGGYDDPHFPFRWHHSSESSGYGALSDLGTHVIDLARFLVGEIDSVSGASETFVKERPVSPGSRKMRKADSYDATIACMKFHNKALGMLETSWLTPGRSDYLRFEAYGSRGTVRFNLERIHELEVFKSDVDPKTRGFRKVQVLSGEHHPYMSAYWPGEGGGFAWEYTFVNEFNHYMNRIADDKPVGPEGATFHDGYRNCQALDAIARSSEKGKWVTVPS